MPESEKRKVSWKTYVVLLLISILGGLLCWNRPVKPLWVDENRSFTSVCGITADGQLASLESNTRLSIRNLETGVVSKRYDIPRVNEFSGAVTDDGKWILLVTANPELLVISLENGSLRYPPISVQHQGFPDLRKDGRYAIIRGAIGGVNSVIDLSNGKLLWTTKSHLSFCGTYQDLVVAADTPSFSNARLVTISDQRDLGAVTLPNVTEHQLQYIRPFIDDRIILTYEILRKGGDLRTKCLSARVSDTQLVDIREEPFLYSEFKGELLVFSSPEGQLRIRNLDQSTSGRRLMKLYEFGSRVGLIKEWTSRQYSWQATVMGCPVGPAIAMMDLAPHLTKDGRYLVECGQRLAVFPISRRSRWPETMAVAALPWLLLTAWRRLRGRRPGLAGDLPVQ